MPQALRLLAPTLAVIIAGACSSFHPTDVKNPNLTDQQFLNCWSVRLGFLTSVG